MSTIFLCVIAYQMFDTNTGDLRFDAIRKAREWVGSLQVRTPRQTIELLEPVAPRCPVEDLLSLVNPDIRKPFDMREVLLRITDDSRLSEFKPKYGTNIITAFAHIQGKQHIRGHYAEKVRREPKLTIFISSGFPVGIIANQLSVLNPTEAAKGAQFILTCNQQYVQTTLWTMKQIN